MKLIDEIFGKECVCKGINKKGKCIIAEIDNKKYVIKNKSNDIEKIYDYLNSVKFEHYPKILIKNNKYYVYEYIDDVISPIEEKACDMINLIGLLHSKTTYYKEMDINEYKKLFEDTVQKIEDVKTYYDKLIGSIERHMFMSPSEYLIARNISKIFGALNYSKQNIIKWYNIVKSNNKKRVVRLYNNMDLNHVLRNSDLYLINWEKSINGSPILDLYNFYKMNYSISNFEQLMKQYEDKYPLEEEEKILFYTLISIPNKINFTFNEIINCKNIKKIVDYIYKSEILISQAYPTKK